MSEKNVGIGIIGGGKAGRNFALAIRSCANAEVRMRAHGSGRPGEETRFV